MTTRQAIGGIAALIGIIAGAIAIYQFVNPEPPPDNPPEELPFLEKAAGTYVLNSWVQAQRTIELGAEVIEGSLSFDRDGTMNWSVLLRQTFASNPGQVRMTARGKVNIGSKKVLCIKGGQYNNTHYLDNHWGQVSPDIQLAVRGWCIGQPEDAFQISIEEVGDGGLWMQMSNSRGTYTWRK